MRLEPIEEPKSLKLRIAYLLTRRRFGKVITPLKVIQARWPASLRLSLEMAKLYEKGTTLDAELKHLITTHVAAINGCGFCLDISRARAAKVDGLLERITALPDFRSSAAFSDREKAALVYVEEATRNKRVSDETFANLRAHFSEREIVEITWLNAMENYYNLQAVPMEIESDGLCAVPQWRREPSHV